MEIKFVARLVRRSCMTRLFERPKLLTVEVDISTLLFGITILNSRTEQFVLGGPGRTF